MFTFQVQPNLTLALLQPHHSQEIYNLVDTNRQHLKHWLGWVDGVQSPDIYRDSIIPAWLQQLAANDGFTAGIRHHGKLVGMINLHFINWKTRSTSIGYYLSEEAQGNGIMQACVTAILQHAFDDLNLNKVDIQCAEGNKRSRHIPERLGFKQEGISRDAEFINGHYNDIVTYSLLAKEWRATSK